MGKTILKKINNLKTYKLGKFDIRLNNATLDIQYIKFNNKNFIYDKNDSWSGAFPFLFPICGKLNNGTFQHENKEYQMKMHGFFHELNWKLNSQTNEKISFSSSNNNVTLQSYPFKFFIQFDVIQKEDNIIFVVNVKNIDHKNMYYSFGFHPSFYCNEDSNIIFESIKKFTTNLNDNGNMTNGDSFNILIKETKVSDLKFPEDGLTYFSKNDKSENVALVTDKFNFNLSFQNKYNDNPNFLLWRRGINKNYICLEPWWGSPDYKDNIVGLKYKKDIQLLEPNNECSYQLKISIEDKE